MPPSEETVEFIESVWPEVPDGMELLIWTMPDKRSHWCKNAAAAAVLVAQLAATKDVYIMTSLQAAGLSPRQRGEAIHTSAMCGLWLDVDIAGSGHSAQPYPPTKEAALDIIYGDSLPAPTWLIHTGGGFHAWWIFVEPWVFADDAERATAFQLAEDWQKLYRARALSAGYTIDSTHDLTRVLRVPGTFNRKIKDHPRPVTVVEKCDVKLNPSEFIALLEECRAADAEAGLIGDAEKTTGKVVEIRPTPPANGDLILDPKAEISPKELRFLTQRFSNFFATWNGERSFKSGKDSQSEYDLTLANYAALCGWSDQQIVNLLIHNRRVRRAELPKHIKAYQKTLAKAREYALKEGAAHPAEKAVEPLTASAEPEKKSTKDAKSGSTQAEEALEWTRESLSLDLQVQVLRLVKIGRHDPQYRLETDRGDIHFASMDEITSQGKFRSRVASSIDKSFPHYKDQDYPRFVGRLLTLVQHESADPDSDPVGSILTWLVQYLESNDFYASWDEARNKDQRMFPHSRDGHIFINSTHLRTWVTKTLNETISVKEIAKRLKQIGAEFVLTSVRKPRTNVAFWRLPQEDFDPQDYLPDLDPATAEMVPDTIDTANIV